MIERVKDNYRRIKCLAPDWNIVPSDEIYYLVEVQDGKDIGAVVLIPEAEGLKIHVAFKYRGPRAATGIRNAFCWAFENTEHTRIIAAIPVKDAYKPVRYLAHTVGMIFNEIEESLFRCYSINK